MAYPHYRGGHNNSYNSLNYSSNSNTMYTRNNSGNRGGGNNRDRVEETNMTLMEMENNQRWVGNLLLQSFLVLESTLICLYLIDGAWRTS
jgi:hypothetical protein